MNKSKPYSRIYVCHTFYHVYISVLKELALGESEHGKATILLSTMSNNFGNIADRLIASKLFKDVLYFHEKADTFFPELTELKKDRGNIVFNSFARIKYTKLFSKLLEKFIPVDFRLYQDIYVYCDNDPIGIYLSQHHIYYHAIEDGLNCLSVFVPAYRDNEGCFWLKKFLSEKLNLIFIRDGFNKYCLDMEVNDSSLIKFPCKKYKDVPRKALTDRLTEKDKEVIISIFVENLDELKQMISTIDTNKKNILILTEPLCDLDTRKVIFDDLYDEYSKEGNVFFKPHPRDILDYDSLFSHVPKFKGNLPMEILNFYSDVHFDKVISVFTQIDAITFADEKVVLGPAFMDRYEEPSKHWLS